MKKIFTFIKKKWKLLLILAIVVAGIGYWYVTTQASSKEVITTEKPTRGNLTKTLEVSGVVDAKEKAQLRFISGGKVVYIGAKEGDTVTKNQTIASIDRAQLQKQLQADLNNYSKERIDFEESKDTDADRTLDRTELRTKEKEQLDLQNSVLDVEIQSLAIRDSWLSAPFSGILTKSPASVTGVQLLAQDIFEIVNPSSLVFRAAVDEADIALVKSGQEALITLDSHQEDEIITSVQYIAYTSSQSSTGTVFIVEMGMPTVTDLNYFRIGMNGDVAITLEERFDILSVPLDATIQRDDKMFIEVKKADGTIEEREIQVGLETDDRIEVTGGLSEQDDVVIPQ